MSAAKQRDGASISGMGWNSRFINHAHHETPYKEGVIPHWGCTVSGRQVAVNNNDVRDRDCTTRVYVYAMLYAINSA